MKKGCTSLIAVGFLISGATTAAQEKDYRLLTDETYLEMETVGGPNISPDGKHILFTRGWVDQMNDRAASNLWITDVEGMRIRELISTSVRPPARSTNSQKAITISPPLPSLETGRWPRRFPHFIGRPISLR